MDKLHFEYLAERLYLYLIKGDTVMTESIKIREQVCVFSRYKCIGCNWMGNHIDL